jgi:hypothetical protein
MNQVNCVFIVAFSVVIALAAFGDDGKPKLPGRAPEIIEKYEDEVQTAWKRYEEAFNRARDLAIRRLQREMKDATRKGNLDGHWLSKPGWRPWRQRQHVRQRCCISRMF